MPLSVTNYTVNLFSLIFFFASVFILPNFFPRIGTVWLTVISLVITLVPLWLYDLLVLHVHRRPSAGLKSQPGPVNQKRLVTKLIGFYGTFLIVLVWYLLLKVCFDVRYLDPFLEFLWYAFPVMIALTFIYFREVDRRQEVPYDEYWHAGCFLTGRFNEVNPVVLQEYARMIFIKGFFTPYLFVYLIKYVGILISADWGRMNFLSFHEYLLNFFYTVDVIYATLGYILTCRLLDTHIRSTEPTVLGWLVCLACYGPFYNHFGIGLLRYDDGLNWNHWFAMNPVFYYFYAFTILFLILVYCLATVAFGCRMSNLTYRGIITSGPYRWTKHPAYVGKVCSWWMISLPFLVVGNPAIAVKNTLALCFISFIYYMRAKTEENHLSNYPEYVEYANWIKCHGAFRFLTKYFPALEYSEEKSRRWGSVVWFKKVDRSSSRQKNAFNL